MRSLFQSLQIKLSSSVNLPKIYIWFNSNSEFCKQYSFSLKAVCDLIEHSLHLFFLFFSFWVVVFVINFFGHIFTPTFAPIFPSRPSRPTFPSIKDKTIFVMSNFHEAQDIFEKHFSIPTILLEISSRLQAHSQSWLCIAGRTLSPSYGCLSDSVFITKKTLKCDLTIQHFSRLFHTVLAVSAVSTWKKQGWKKIVNVKEKYEITRNSKFHLGTISNSASCDTFIPSRQEQLSFKTDFPHWTCCVPFFEP